MLILNYSIYVFADLVNILLMFWKLQKIKFYFTFIITLKIKLNKMFGGGNPSSTSATFLASRGVLILRYHALTNSLAVSYQSYLNPHAII